MTNFPIAETDIMALSQKMLDGYQWHAADFPKVRRILLISRRSTYIAARRNRKQANAALKIASKAARKSFQELVLIMKNCLQKSEVDTAGNPEKLKQIGWGPRAEPQPSQLPTQPLNLQIIAKDDRIVKLKWDRPDDNQLVRNYIIERRQQDKTGMSNWMIYRISYETQATLRSQPMAICLEYRIRATNNAGTGPFSNTVSVVL